MNILPKLLSLFTGPRYMPVIEWSAKSWTHNVFRCYEMLFGRKAGIRKESATSYDGRTLTVSVYTFEAFCAYVETRIRSWFKLRLPFKIAIKQLVPVSGLSSPFMFAVALDTSVDGGDSTSSWSHTVTGSNPIIIVSTGGRSTTANAGTYNSVSLTQLGSTVTLPTSGLVSMMYLINPATGAHTVAISGTTTYWHAASVSYTGVNQASFPDSSNTNTATGSNTCTVSTTVVAANCWLVAAGLVYGGGNTGGISSNRTDRKLNLLFFTDSSYALTVSDSNTTVSTGSQSIIYTPIASMSGSGAICASLAPVPPTVNYTLTAAQASFTLSGQTTNFTKALTMTAAVASFALTGFAALFSRLKFLNQDSRTSSTFTQDNRTSVASLSQDTKTVSTLTLDDRT